MHWPFLPPVRTACGRPRRPGWLSSCPCSACSGTRLWSRVGRVPSVRTAAPWARRPDEGWFGRRCAVSVAAALLELSVFSAASAPCSSVSSPAVYWCWWTRQGWGRRWRRDKCLSRFLVADHYTRESNLPEREKKAWCWRTPILYTHNYNEHVIGQ